MRDRVLLFYGIFKPFYAIWCIIVSITVNYLHKLGESWECIDYCKGFLLYNCIMYIVLFILPKVD